MQLKMARSQNDVKIIHDHLRRALDQLESIQGNLVNMLDNSNEPEGRQWSRIIEKELSRQRQINKHENKILSFGFWRGLSVKTRDLLTKNLYRVFS